MKRVGGDREGYKIKVFLFCFLTELQWKELGEWR